MHSGNKEVEDKNIISAGHCCTLESYLVNKPVFTFISVVLNLFNHYFW